MKDNKKNTHKWYDNPNIITNIAISVLVLIIVLSQSYAVNNNLGTTNILRSLLNHNSMYILGLIYFIPLKLVIGKKYFYYLNFFLILVYSIFTVTGILTFIQSFGLTSLVTFSINAIMLIYMLHTLLRGSGAWTDFKIEKSPFNEISNTNYFSTIVILSVILLTINLIETATVAGTVISILGCCYSCIMGRYIYLYRSHNDKISIKEKGE